MVVIWIDDGAGENCHLITLTPVTSKLFNWFSEHSLSMWKIKWFAELYSDSHPNQPLLLTFHWEFEGQKMIDLFSCHSVVSKNLFPDHTFQIFWVQIFSLHCVASVAVTRSVRWHFNNIGIILIQQCWRNISHQSTDLDMSWPSSDASQPPATTIPFSYSPHACTPRPRGILDNIRHVPSVTLNSSVRVCWPRSSYPPVTKIPSSPRAWTQKSCLKHVYETGNGSFFHVDL